MDEFQYITMINKIDHLKTIKAKVELYRKLYEDLHRRKYGNNFTSVKESVNEIHLFKCLERIETTLDKFDERIPKNIFKYIEGLKRGLISMLIREKASFETFKDIFKYTTHIELRYISKDIIISMDEMIKDNNIDWVDITYNTVSDVQYSRAFNRAQSHGDTLAKIVTLEQYNVAITDYKSTIFNDCLNKLYKTLPEDTTNIADVVKQLQREYNTSVNAMLEKL